MKILVIRLSSIGDIVIATSAISALKRRYPNSSITLLTKTEYAEIAPLIPEIDSLLLFSQKEGLTPLIRNIRRERFDLLIDLQNSLRTKVISSLSSVKRRVSFKKRTVSRLFLTLFHTDGPPIEHISARYIEPLKAFGVREEEPRLSLDRAKIEEVLKRFGIGEEKVIAVAPGTRHRAKQWSEERWAELIERLKGSWCERVLVIGGEEERSVVDRIKRVCRIGFSDFVGKTSLSELAVIIKKSILLISSDTGPMHIADALKVPTVALFGPTTRHFGFYPKRGVIVEKELSCRPCSLHGEKPCRKRECMEKIEVADVLEAADAVLNKKRYTSIRPKKVLVIQTAYLGDSILTTPLIRVAKESFSSAKLTLLSTPTGCEALSGNPHIDSFICYDKKRSQRGLFWFFKVAREIRREGFDLVLLPHRSLRSTLLSLLSGARMRVGFDKAVFSFLLTHKAVYRREKHEAERYLDLLRILGIADDGRGLDMFLTEHSKERAESLFKKWKVSSGKAVGLIIGSQWKTKRWPASHFARLVDLLYDEMGAVCIIFGTDADRETANKVYTLSKNKPIIACGETRVSDLPALFTKCYLLIGGDTGSMHIGVAVDAKCVVIFGPTTPELGFGPYRGDAVVVEKKGLSCRPCSLHGSDKCKEKHFFCMEKITPEEVLSAALSLQLAS